MNKIILFIPPVHWNYYPYRDQELPMMLAKQGYSCIYLNPLEYKGCEKAQRFSRVNSRQAVEGMRIISRSTRLRKSFFLFLYENVLNFKEVMQCKPDVVISTNHLSAVITCLMCYFRGIRFIFDVTDNWELVDTSRAGKFYKFIIKPVMARFAFAITTTSQKQFSYFNKVRKNQTWIISNGVSPDILNGLKQIRKDDLERMEVNFIGSLRDWYDFDVLFDVFKELPEITLNIYGQGPLFQQLKQKAEGISNIYLRGNIENKHIPELLLNTLFGVLPLKPVELNNSTCPIKLLEYWAASKAVIATPVDEVKRIGGNALLYADTKKTFLEMAQLLITDRELKLKLGKMGYDKIENTHNYELITRQFMNIFTWK
jgi:glycosyltransferase involved in cell wall biosynthesis